MSLRDLPSVERLLQTEAAGALRAAYGRPLTLQALRLVLDGARQAIRGGGGLPLPGQILLQAQQTLEDWLAPTLRPVINATGVIVHTNLGRAPLSPAARRALAGAAGTNSLEFNLARGGRGLRDQHAEDLLRRLTGAQAALVVNNNAAAVLLALTALARGQDVLISRSQLVEIGGGFRVPDVLKQSGARLVEVGTTNRTHLADYEAALSARTGVILRAHHSNFKIVGFTTEPSLSELVELGARQRVAVVDDLGSGALLDTSAFGLGHEPTVQESLQAGAAAVCFSGDKLLGGPQAGIIVGTSMHIEPMRRHPLARALRPDKLCLAALAATLEHYLRDEALREIPVWRMIAAPAAELEGRARVWQTRLGQGEVRPGLSTVGGGSLPEETLPTWLLVLPGPRPNALVGQLRRLELPIIARVEDDCVALDPRTVLPEDEDNLLAGLSAALGGGLPLRGEG
ncbi:MAG: L-seryl-tRNA(Sec) selenium transferase [Chloroflexi bacterium RBG_13_68_17]|nr:MAG: L-seryl-tRNA(Sec) selenium transferase [Chloroflexi bacterium RBG_13_68_17]